MRTFKIKQETIQHNGGHRAHCPYAESGELSMASDMWAGTEATTGRERGGATSGIVRAAVEPTGERDEGSATGSIEGVGASRWALRRPEAARMNPGDERGKGRREGKGEGKGSGDA